MSHTPKNASFGILRATADAWRFVAQNIGYLAKTGVTPLGVALAGNLFILYVRPDSSTLEASLWTLPASVLFSWYSFVIARKIVLGETLDALSNDLIAKSAREEALRASVLLSLLFNMGVTAAAAGLEMIAHSGLIQTGNVVMTGLFAFTALVMFWGLRLGALPILAAVDYPLAPFLRQVDGFVFSLHLLGLGVLSIMPLVIVSQLIFAPMIANPLEPTENELLFMVCLGAPLSLMIVAVLTAATTFALKELLGKKA